MVNKKYIGSTIYVSDASRLTDTYGYNGDVAYVIDELTKKVLSVHTKFNGHWIGVQIDEVPTEGSTNPVTSGGVYTSLTSINSRLGNISFVQCTQAEYDTMSEHDQNTLYIVIDSGGE